LLFVVVFWRDARAAARLSHPNIVTIFEIGQEGDYYYYAMEYLEGQTVSQLIHDSGPLAPDVALSILQPLADALDYAHHNGVVHRDIKPGNVIVCNTGRVALTDFGIARAAQESRLTASGTVIGSPEYMSPEQTRGLTVDGRSDQYSLAVVAYEMLSGQAPFKADSTLSLMYKVVHEPPPPICQSRPDLPPEVEEALGRALAKQPGDRYPSVTAFVEALQTALATKAVRKTPARMMAPRATSPARSRKTSPAVALPETTTPPPGMPGGRALQPSSPVSRDQPASGPIAAVARRSRPATARRRLPRWAWALAALALLILAGLAVAIGELAGPRGTNVGAVITAIATFTATPSPQSLPTLTEAPLIVSAPTMEEPLATPLPTALPTRTPAPSATAASSVTPAPTDTPSPTFSPTQTARPTSPPSPGKTSTVAPSRTPTPAARFAAPVLVAPPNGQVFDRGAEIVLQWQPVGNLPAEGYYEIIVTYPHGGDTWTDETPWIKDTRWTLSEHSYLPDLADGGLFQWSVQVMQKTGEDAKGKPIGTALSPASEVRTLTWQPATAGGGGGGGGGGQEPSPPVQPTRPPAPP
jgi:hypothetical protein